MALQTFKGRIFFPERPPFGAGAIAFTSSGALDGTLEAIAYIFQAPKTGNLAKVGFRTTTVTTGATMDVRIESVSLTTGDPAGTLWSTTTNGSQVIADTDDNVWFLTTLTSVAAVTRGDWLAVVIQQPVASFGNMTLATAPTGIAFETPYADHLATAVWTKRLPTLIMALEYDDGSYDPIIGALPWSAVTNSTYNNTSTPDERGLKFKVPFRCKVGGAWLWANLANNCTIKLYDSDGSTVLESLALDGDVSGSATPARRTISFDSVVTLEKDTFYRLTLLPTAASDVALEEFTVNSAALMDAMSGGQNLHLTTRTDAGSWTDTTTQRPLMGIAIEALDDAVTGPKVHPGMTGGMRG